MTKELPRNEFGRTELGAAAIMIAARECVANGERVTSATIKARLPEAKFPGLGEIGNDEAQAAFEAIEQEAERHAASLEADAPAEPADEPQEPQPEAANVPTLSPDEAREYLRLAHVALAEARAAVTTKTNVRNRAREVLANAVQAWQTGMPKMTREQAVRESIASFQQDRANHVQSSSTPGPSRVDRTAFYSKGGDAGDFARKQMRRGGYHRGAYPSQARGQRLPSER